MLIPCPHCGPRGHEEFAYLGDATILRPADSAAVEDFARYVYIRDNPAGRLRESWYHGGGCQAWLVVTRDVRTHEIFAAEDAHDVASRAPA